MTTQPPDTAAAEKMIADITARAKADANPDFWLYHDRAYLLAQLTAANERADNALNQESLATDLYLGWRARAEKAEIKLEQATAEAVVLYKALRKRLIASPEGRPNHQRCDHCNYQWPFDDREVHQMDCPIGSLSPIAAAHLSEYRRLVEGQRWSGIESAPDDGTPFLACHIGKENRIDIAIKFDGKVEDCEGNERLATHWLPLPEPPIRAGVKP